LAVTNSSPGAYISQAADLAAGAERLVIAALIHLEDAEADNPNLAFLEETPLEGVDLVELLHGLAAFASNLLSLADAYGHAEVRRRRPTNVR
jgi:hypothetical protein